MLAPNCAVISDPLTSSMTLKVISWKARFLSEGEFVGKKPKPIVYGILLFFSLIFYFLPFGSEIPKVNFWGNFSDSLPVTREQIFLQKKPRKGLNWFPCFAMDRDILSQSHNPSQQTRENRWLSYIKDNFKKYFCPCFNFLYSRVRVRKVVRNLFFLKTSSSQCCWSHTQVCTHIPIMQHNFEIRRKLHSGSAPWYIPSYRDLLSRSTVIELKAPLKILTCEAVGTWRSASSYRKSQRHRSA